MQRSPGGSEAAADTQNREARLPESPFAQPAAQVLVELGVDPAAGLSDDAAQVALQRFGANELASAPPEPLWKKFLRQFADPLIGLLVAAALIAGAMGEWIDAAAILAIVVLNAILGFVQEERAERALAALQKMASPTARALRDGVWKSVPARGVVVGDVVQIHAGDHIPADARLLEAFSLAVQEAALTGESVPVDKEAAAVLPRDVHLADRRNMIYLGTVAAAGKGTALVVATGMRTELGRIAGMLESHQAEPTPLQRELAGFSRTLIVVCMALVVVVFGIKLANGEPLLEAFLLSVSLAVAAVPEGLPAVVTLALAIGLQRMARRNALIRKLPCVETLGSVTVVCTDKTGTLTRNEMTVREILVDGAHYRVEGSGYAPQGRFLKERDGSFEPIDEPAKDAALALLLTIALRCNNAQISPADRDGEDWCVVGDPTEGALLAAAMKGGVDADARAEPIVHEIPFDSERKVMSVVVQLRDGSHRMLTKGAPESVLPRCSAELRGGVVVPMDPPRRAELTRQPIGMTERALRVLALAYRDCDATNAAEHEERELVFVGLAGMIDPPRDEVKPAVALCKTAGILPVMITGDHARTALAVARELDLASDAAAVVEGRELEKMSEDQLAERVDSIRVYARVSAADKLRVVKAWKARGEVVAMTGDGVNDAPAVQAADIGVAMGVTGTDVTRQASSMVLLDDNFASIVSAVEEGRAIYGNIQKFLIYLLSCNAGELLLMFLSSLWGWPAPLAAVQLLWINLVTDGLAALALGLEAPEPGIMRRRPRRRGRGMISLKLAATILFQGVVIAGVALFVFRHFYGGDPANLQRARTITFCVLVYSELLRALAARSRRATFFELGPFTNLYLIGAILLSLFLQASIIAIPFARPIFETTHLPLAEWGLILLVGLIPVSLLELVKLVLRRPPSDDSND